MTFTKFLSFTMQSILKEEQCPGSCSQCKLLFSIHSIHAIVSADKVDLTTHLVYEELRQC